jgi:hypothetical protein
MHMNQWGGGEGHFVPVELWDACHDPDLPPLLPGDKTPLILALDAASTGDCFGAIAVTRHPHRHEDPAIRAVKLWTPPPGGRIQYEGWTCPQCHAAMRLPDGDDADPFHFARHHPNQLPGMELWCTGCDYRGPGQTTPFEFVRWVDANYNFYQVPYDPFQLESFSKACASS